jgi:hypothetical protein
MVMDVEAQAASRRKAEALLERKDQAATELARKRDNENALFAAKTARLRALRLAKEAAEKAAAPPRTVRSRRTADPSR